MEKQSIKFKSIVLQNLHWIRRVVQISTIILLIAVPILNKNNFNEIIGTFYSISFWALDIVDPALVLQSIILNREIVLTLIVGAIIPLILAIVLGKVFCSWMCPFHLFSEFGELLRKKVKGIKNVNNKNPHKKNYWITYIIILLLVIITCVPIITLISMPGLISSQIADAILFRVIGIELLLVIIIIVIEIFIAPRFWCKFACPVGATLALFRNNRTLKIEYDPQKCAECQAVKDKVCNQVCPLNLNPKKKDLYPFCNNCLECVSVCQKNGKALNVTFNKK